MIPISKNKITPKVSIIMGVYNGEKYVSRAVESVLYQTFNDFEFIIIDDASSDKTSAILNSYQDHRIQIIRNENNIGLTKSLNKGIEFAKSELIARQDADDQSTPDRIKVQYEFLLENPDVGLVGSYVEFLDDNLRPTGQWKMPVEDNEIRNKLDTGNTFSHGSVLIRRSVMNKVGLYREKFRFTQDYELWLRVAEITQLANIDQVLYRMYRGKNRISRTKLDIQLAYQVIARQLAQERKTYGYDKYDNLDGSNPEFWITTYYPELSLELFALKNKNYGWQLNESIRQKDFLEVVRLKRKLSELNKEKIDIRCSIKDFISITLKFLSYQYSRF